MYPKTRLALTAAALLVADDIATEAKVMLVKSDTFPGSRLRS
jgi:hypothetical protein